LRLRIHVQLRQLQYKRCQLQWREASRARCKGQAPKWMLHVKGKRSRSPYASRLQPPRENDMQRTMILRQHRTRDPITHMYVMCLSGSSRALASGPDKPPLTSCLPTRAAASTVQGPLKRISSPLLQVLDRPCPVTARFVTSSHPLLMLALRLTCTWSLRRKS
jgi:hypothetical protein